MQSKLTSENLNKVLEFLSTKQCFENNKASNEFKKWMFEKYNFSVESFTDADFGELIAINEKKGYVMITSSHSIKPEGKAFLANGGWVNKENIENELIENSRKSLKLAEANNILTLSNKQIAKNTFIATIVGIIITILTFSIEKLSCNKIDVSTKPPIADTVKNKQNN